RCRGLTSVVLDDNSLTCAGAGALASAVPHCPVLERVSLRRNLIRHAGAFALEEANYLLSETRGSMALMELSGQRSMSVNMPVGVPHQGWSGC
ncbi:hypothetical protein T484DRAFT_1969287, partial [Baffinella frigidus]